MSRAYEYDQQKSLTNKVIRKLLELLSIRPLTLNELQKTTGSSSSQIVEAIRYLEKSNTITHEWHLSKTKSKTLPKKITSTKVFKIRRN